MNVNQLIQSGSLTDPNDLRFLISRLSNKIRKLKKQREIPGNDLNRINDELNRAYIYKKEFKILAEQL